MRRSGVPGWCFSREGVAQSRRKRHRVVLTKRFYPYKFDLNRFHKCCYAVENGAEQLFLTEKLRRRLLDAYTFCENGRAGSLRLAGPISQ
jgi:hypothetical protein